MDIAGNNLYDFKLGISINFINMSSRTIEVIENDLDQENKIMFVHQKNGNYGDAEKSRLKI